jgi:DNA integrity scanning protein DisA with diadenylate cyclase activity
MNWFIFVTLSAFVVAILTIVIMAMVIASQREKIKRAGLHIKALSAVYEEMQKIEEFTNEKIKQMDNVDSCINYLNGNKLRVDSAEGWNIKADGSDTADN